MGLRGNFVVLGPTYYRIVEHPVNRIEQFQSHLNAKRQNQQKEKQTTKQKTLLPTSGAADRRDSGDPAALLVTEELR